MDSGRIQAIIIATSAGNVVYERFYEKFGEQEKAELRATVAESAEESLKTNPQGTDFTSRWRDSVTVFKQEDALWFFAVGYGEYDELNLSEILGAFIIALRDNFKKTLSEALLFENYGRLCLILDEMMYEGLLDKVDPSLIQRGIAMKEQELKS